MGFFFNVWFCVRVKIFVVVVNCKLFLREFVYVMNDVCFSLNNV